MAFPKDGAADSSIPFLRQGYEFIPRRCRRLGSDVFETRIMLTKAICATGAGAAEMFYGGARFTRVGAMPQNVLRLLQDKGSVQLLDGGRHRHRKAMFLAVLDDRAVQRLADIFEEEWRRAVPEWARRDRIVLFDEVRAVLTRTVCRWAGVPFEERHLAAVTREFSEMIEATGTLGPRNWRALVLRRRTERWARNLVARVRSGALAAAQDSALGVVANHVDEKGRPLPEEVAAVELINILRPTVAVGRFIVFAALALHEHPAARDRLRGAEDDGAAADRFVQEVRRFYPFFPMIGGRARQAFEWRGEEIPEGQWVLLDLYGTNHDERLWRKPGRFDPERFRGWTSTGYDLVPQGAGSPETGHRCPGEGATVELTKRATRLLSEVTAYEVPEQDLAVDLSQIPALPRSGVIMAKPRLRD